MMHSRRSRCDTFSCSRAAPAAYSRWARRWAARLLALAAISRALTSAFLRAAACSRARW